MTDFTDPEVRTVGLTAQQITTIKDALEAVQFGRRNLPRTDPEVDELIADAYRAMSVELIQRIPTRGDRWRGLTNPELEDVMASIMFFEESVRVNGRGGEENRKRLGALLKDASDEMTRRKPNWLDEDPEGYAS